MPSTTRARSFTSPTTRTPSAPSRRAPPPMASFFLASDSSRSSLPALIQHLRQAAGHLLERHFEFRRRRSWRARPNDARTCAPWSPVSASMRRTPAATPLSATPGDETDVAGAPDVGAAAKLHRPAHGVAAALAHGDDAHLVAVFLAEQRARAGRNRVIDRHQPRGDRRVLQHDVVGDVLDPLDLLAPSSAWDARSRSAAGRAPPASPSAPRDRRAPGAAPRAAGASPNDCRRMALRRA